MAAGADTVTVLTLRATEVAVTVAVLTLTMVRTAVFVLILMMVRGGARTVTLAVGQTLGAASLRESLWLAWAKVAERKEARS